MHFKLGEIFTTLNTEFYAHVNFSEKSQSYATTGFFPILKLRIYFG